MQYSNKILFGLVALFALTARAATERPETLLAKPGKLLMSEDFAKPLPPATGDISKFPSGFTGWRYNLSTHAGHWTVQDGALTGAEIAASKHPGTASYGLRFKDVVIACDMRLNDVPLAGRARRTISLRLTDKNDYICGVYLDEGGVRLRKEDRDHGGPDKVEVLGEIKSPLKLNEWHHVVVEIIGEEMVATVDGRSVAGRHPAIGEDKHSLMILVGGEGSVRNLKVWEAGPNPGWAKNKARLMEKAAPKAE